MTLTRNTLLVELSTEELPPGSLLQLGMAFATNLTSLLSQHRFLENPVGDIPEDWVIASPRHLGAAIPDVNAHQPDQVQTLMGPPLSIALKNGQPTQAAEGFAKKCGVSFDDLQQTGSTPGDKLFYEQQQPGRPLADLISELVSTALDRLPIPKRMRWGDRRDSFVRPVHRLLCLYGEEVLPCRTMGLEAGRISLAHRNAPQPIVSIQSADSYTRQMRDEGMSLTGFLVRKKVIIKALLETASAQQAILGIDESGEGQDSDLLNEVTALVEWPVPLTGSFDEDFLRVPAACLISSMKGHQKYFPLFDAVTGKLLNRFVTMANLESRDPARVIEGNERVIRPRLADARFFYETDLKTPLSARTRQLGNIIFQKSLGTLLDKSERIARVAVHIAEQIQADANKARQAAMLCKCDLVTEMVLEFPELQGHMGYQYAIAEGIDPDVAEALESHYQPRDARDNPPSAQVSIAVALADRLDTLTGIFGINQSPTGSRDPFALRRAALGILKTLQANQTDLDLNDLLEATIKSHEVQGSTLTVDTHTLKKQLLQFFSERYYGIYQTEGFDRELITAVLNPGSNRPVDVDQRLRALNSFKARPEAQRLSAAHKRVGNILSKSADFATCEVREDLLTEAAEQDLFAQLIQVETQASAQRTVHAHLDALLTLEAIGPALDRFFEQVMVNADEPAVRSNRLNLLRRLDKLMSATADLGCLSQ
jgi:glycyl-tRNA synthetase beta chain